MMVTPDKGSPSNHSPSKRDADADADADVDVDVGGVADGSRVRNDRDLYDLAGDEGDEGDEGDDSDPADDSDEGDPRRAAFLDDLPDVAELRPLVASYVEGNYARLRQQEQVLREQTADTEILSAARELVLRTEPDRLSKALLGLSIAFFLFIIGWVYLHHGKY